MSTCPCPDPDHNPTKHHAKSVTRTFLTAFPATAALENSGSHTKLVTTTTDRQANARKVTPRGEGSAPETHGCPHGDAEEAQEAPPAPPAGSRWRWGSGQAAALLRRCQDTEGSSHDTHLGKQQALEQSSERFYAEVSCTLNLPAQQCQLGAHVRRGRRK